MRKKQIWSLSGIGLIGIVAILFWAKTVAILNEKPVPSSLKQSDLVKQPKQELAVEPQQNKLKVARKQAEQKIKKASAAANKVVALGLKRLGTPYVFGAASEKAFDCSGFVFFIFDKAGVKVPRSSELLASAGKPVPRQKVRPGDILIFTGTNSSIRKPGHVGIVIKNTNKEISFVHASSNGGVKISQVEGTNYERRFLEIRRVL
jgi:cell wall-associated NlpC family hydrolase